MKNPILQDIKREYPLAYEMATQACSVLRNVSPNPIKGGRDPVISPSALRWHWNGRRPKSGHLKTS